MVKIRVRFAPSPTGLFHIGTARTVLFNYLFAKKHKGDFILRIEDTDKQRSEKKYEKDILNNLKWLGLKYDEIYYQSKRKEIYKKYLKQLLDSGHAYKDEIIWFKNPNKKIVFNDLVRGDIEFDSSLFGDFSIAKSLDEPLYNLAVVVDDHEMNISHVIRGEDHISNTPKQILIYQALGFDIPKYAHVPLILGPDKSKLSKRHGTVSISDYRGEGYLAEALINFMALLGWNPGNDKEIFSLKELIKEFSLDKVQKGGAIFNINKLNWFNNQYIKNTPSKELAKLIKLKHTKLEKIIDIEKERINKLTEIEIGFYSKLPKYSSSLLKWKDMKKAEIKQSLDKSYDILCDVKDFNEKSLKDILIKNTEDDKGRLLWPLRVALSGKKNSPSPFEIGEVLGKQETLKRIKKAIDKV